MLAAQLREVHRQQATEPAILAQQPRRQLDDVLLRGAHPQNDGQQLRRLQRSGAVVLESLARALVAGHLADGAVVRDARDGGGHTLHLPLRRERAE